MRAGWARELLAALLIAAAAALACSPAMARNDTPRTDTPQAGRWQWLAHTYWYVPRANLLALASSPARRTPAPVSDQTVYYISNYADGYFWGTTAVSYTRPGGSAASAQVSCLQLVGSVTPEGDVHLTFTPLSAKPAPSGGSRFRANHRLRHHDQAVVRVDHGKSDVHDCRRQSAVDALGIHVPVQAEPALLCRAAGGLGQRAGVSSSLRAGRRVTADGSPPFRQAV